MVGAYQSTLPDIPVFELLRGSRNSPPPKPPKWAAMVAAGILLALAVLVVLAVVGAWTS